MWPVQAQILKERILSYTAFAGFFCHLKKECKAPDKRWFGGVTRTIRAAGSRCAPYNVLYSTEYRHMYPRPVRLDFDPDCIVCALLVSCKMESRQLVSSQSLALVHRSLHYSIVAWRIWLADCL